MSFSDLGLAEDLVRAVHDKGYTTPSPIQAQAIPAILTGRDVMAAAQTGTGKTAGFTLPLLQRLSAGQPVQANQCRALVLTPTRELAAQVGASVSQYGQHLALRSAVVFGGVKINPQMMLLRKGADVLVATPGRLLDLYQQNAVKFHALEVLVLDEADRMLDMGFIHDIRKILAILPQKRQNLLFSATFSHDIRDLARSLMQDPVEIDISPRNSTAETVNQVVHPVDKARKTELLSHLIRSKGWRQALVFSRTKHGSNKLVAQLQQDGINATVIHGNKSQGARTKALDDFKNGEASVLVATDIAARGLDIAELPQVINFDLPNVPEDYVHRIGRTGRAGASGQAISLVSADEYRLLWDIEKLIDRKIPREDIKGFEPEHAVPESKGLKGAPKPPKKPKQKDAPRAPRPKTKPAADAAVSTKPSFAPAVHSGSRLQPRLVEVRVARPRADQVPLAPVTRDSRGAYVAGSGSSYSAGAGVYKASPVDARLEGGFSGRDKPYGQGFAKGGGGKAYAPRDNYGNGPAKPYGARPKNQGYKPASGYGNGQGDDYGNSYGNGNTYGNGNGYGANGYNKKPYGGGYSKGGEGPRPYHGQPKRPYRPDTGNGYVGVYQPTGGNDYLTEQHIQSFGNRADIPPAKSRGYTPKPTPPGGGYKPKGAKPFYSGPKKPYPPRDGF